MNYVEGTAGWVRITYSADYQGVLFTIAANAPSATRARITAEQSALSPVPTQIVNSPSPQFTAKLRAGVCGAKGSAFYNATDGPANQDLGLFCDNPPRAGISISGDIPNTQGLGYRCTAGFTVVSPTTGNLYMLTAGHCLKIAPTGWITPSSSSTRYAIGSATGDEKFNQSLGQDWGMITAPANIQGWVLNRPSRYWYKRHVKSNTRFTPTVQSASITGTILCLTGSRTGSHCGVVPKGGFGLNGGRRGLLNTCPLGQGFQYPKGEILSGDSGGPVFGKRTASSTSGTANGLIADTPDLNEPCQMSFESIPAVTADLHVVILGQGGLSSTP